MYNKLTNGYLVADPEKDPEKAFQLNDNFEPSSGSNMVVGYLLILTSMLITILTFPLSLFFVIKVGKRLG